MQSVIIDKPYRFVPPMKTTAWSTLYRWLSLHHFYLSRFQKVTSHELRGLDRFLESLRAGHGIMLAPNHSREADPFSLCWIPYEAKCHCYGMASWHLFQHPLQRWLLRSMGGFSINREAVDTAAVNFAIDVLASAERPVIVYPEGATSRTNDRIAPLLEGVLLIARTAARRRAKKQPGGTVVIHPVAIKYLFQGDVQKAIDHTLSRLEERLGMSPRRDVPLKRRVIEFGLALLAQKETEFLGEPQSGQLQERLDRLVARLLEPHEEAILGRVQPGHPLHRMRALRVKVLAEMREGLVDEAERQRRWKILSELYLAQQVATYPSDYLSGTPTIDRLLDLVSKYEEDLTDVVTIHSSYKVIIEIDKAIEVTPQRERGINGDPLVGLLQERIQGMLDRLSKESPPAPAAMLDDEGATDEGMTKRK
jgi:1-acyl-sn-glycerol-3-phosphate acyltransferase